MVAPETIGKMIVHRTSSMCTGEETTGTIIEVKESSTTETKETTIETVAIEVVDMRTGIVEETKMAIIASKERTLTSIQTRISVSTI